MKQKGNQTTITTQQDSCDNVCWLAGWMDGGLERTKPLSALKVSQLEARKTHSEQNHCHPPPRKKFQKCDDDNMFCSFAVHGCICLPLTLGEQTKVSTPRSSILNVSWTGCLNNKNCSLTARATVKNSMPPSGDLENISGLEWLD